MYFIRLSTLNYGLNCAFSPSVTAKKRKGKKRISLDSLSTKFSVTQPRHNVTDITAAQKTFTNPQFIISTACKNSYYSAFYPIIRHTSPQWQCLSSLPPFTSFPKLLSQEPGSTSDRTGLRLYKIPAENSLQNLNSVNPKW